MQIALLIYIYSTVFVISSCIHAMELTRSNRRVYIIDNSVADRALFMHTTLFQSDRINNLAQSAHLSPFQLSLGIQQALVRQIQIQTVYTSLAQCIVRTLPINNLGGLDVFKLQAISPPLIKAVDSLVYTLYTQNGYPKTVFSDAEKYHIARTITDYLKYTAPDRYLSYITNLSKQGHNEFNAVIQEETKFFPWCSNKLHSFGGLVKDFFIAATPQTPVLQFANTILSNPYTQDLEHISSLCAKGQFNILKELLETYKHKYNHDLYHNLCAVYYHALEQDWLRFYGVKPTSLVLSFFQRATSSETPHSVATLFYNTLAQHPDHQSLLSLLNKYQLPVFYNNLYNDSFVQELNLPQHVTPVVVPNYLLAFTIACLHPADARAEQHVRTAIRYLNNAFGQASLNRAYFDLARATMQTFEKSDADDTILRCSHLITSPVQFSDSRLETRTVTLAANLVNDINELKNRHAPQSAVTPLQAYLLQLDDYMGQLHEKGFESYRAFDELTRDVQHKLNIFNRPALHRSPSLEELCQLLQKSKVDLTISTQQGTFSLDELRKFHGTFEQNVLNQEMLAHGEHVKAHIGNYEHCKEVLQTYNQLIEAAYELNKANKIALAKGIFTVAKDTVYILATDFPLKEVGSYTVETVTHPLEYVARSIEGFKNFAGLVLEYCKYNSQLIATSPEEQLAYSKRCNNALNSFLEQWQQLSYEQKKEYTAHLVVDCIINKAVGGLANIGATKISEGIGHVAGIINEIGSDIPPLVGNAAVAIQPYADLACSLEVLAADAAVVPVGAAVSATLDATDLVMFAIRNDVLARGDYKVVSIKPDKIQLEKVDMQFIKNCRPKEVIHKIILSPENKTIKQFEILAKHYDHMFSDEHVRDGIMALGTNETNIMDQCTSIVLPLDRQGMLSEGSLQIETVMHGCKVTIRLYIQSGMVLGYDAFIGHSNNIIGKLIQVILIE